MKLAIIGGTGFLGNYFLEDYAAHFSHINYLSRSGHFSQQNATQSTKMIKGDLGSEPAVSDLMQGMDVLVHAGFDHDYADNIRGIQNIIQSLNKETNSVKRVVYLSSYVVYDRERDVMDENSPLSGYGDIYTEEKLAVEKIIREAESAAEFIVLQPTIVLGVGGNWSKVLFEAVESGTVSLPKRGEGICNYVYAKDVAKAIFRAANVASDEHNEIIALFWSRAARRPGGKFC